MTTVDTVAPTISIRERNGDVVSDQWPVTVMPQPDELLSSCCTGLPMQWGSPESLRSCARA